MKQQISVKGVENLTKFIDALSYQEIEFYIFVDDFQAQQPKEDKHFGVYILDDGDEVLLENERD